MAKNNLKIGDIVINEYNNTGKLVNIEFEEASVEVWNYGLKNDTEYCDIKLCRLATEEEILEAFKVNKT
jgi:hypothetical protein